MCCSRSKKNYNSNVIHSRDERNDDDDGRNENDAADHVMSRGRIALRESGSCSSKFKYLRETFFSDFILPEVPIRSSTVWRSRVARALYYSTSSM